LESEESQPTSRPVLEVQPYNPAALSGVSFLDSAYHLFLSFITIVLSILQLSRNTASKKATMQLSGGGLLLSSAAISCCAAFVIVHATSSAKVWYRSIQKLALRTRIHFLTQRKVTLAKTDGRELFPEPAELVGLLIFP
jgi:hypothetical protein